MIDKRLLGDERYDPEPDTEGAAYCEVCGKPTIQDIFYFTEGGGTRWVCQECGCYVDIPGEDNSWA